MKPMPMTDFIQLVRDMRAAQKAYFRTRTTGDLGAAKRLEAAVDRQLEQNVGEAEKQGDQPSFFGPDEWPQ